MENMQFFLEVCKFKDLGSFKVQLWRAVDNLKVHTIKVNVVKLNLFIGFCNKQRITFDFRNRFPYFY
jgi:hypothetical protein